MTNIRTLAASALIALLPIGFASCGGDDDDSGKDSRVETTDYTVNGITFKMVKVEGGTFLMGSEDGLEDEKPVHEVSISTFSISQTEVTEDLYKAVMGKNLSRENGSLPAATISHVRALEFIKKLNELTGKIFRLPTEAEWEFAARGGVKSKGFAYSGSNNINDVAWWKGNTTELQPVATKAPNDLGIYDMSGNAYEWCNDWYSEDYYGRSLKNDPSGPTGANHTKSRVLRGGSVHSELDATHCRVTQRNSETENWAVGTIGIRLALSE